MQINVFNTENKVNIQRSIAQWGHSCSHCCMILTMNNFVFNDEQFIQQHGTAMGTRMAPAFANLFMGEFERKALEGYV